MLETPPSLKDTIAARATAPGQGAIAIVRLSGPEALAINAKIAPSKTPRTSHKMQIATITHGNQVIDEALVVEMHGPHSYTGEDCVEYNLHGSQVVVERLLEALYALGARQAHAGEFTQRAFLNGRMDLTQAEAVGDLIASRNHMQHAIALKHLKGGLSQRVQGLHGRLEGALADWRAVFDFPEYEVGSGITPDSLKTLDDVREALQHLLRNAKIDLHRGRRVVLCGPSNAGKSSLLNALAGEERVLVHHEAGTTRDPVEIEIHHGMQRLLVCDTAGFRDDPGDIEAQGIALTKRRVAEADLAVWLVDPQDPKWPEPQFAARLVGAKADLCDPSKREELEAQAQAQGRTIDLWLSAHDGEGLERLKNLLAAIKDDESTNDWQDASGLVVRERHSTAIDAALTHLDRTLTMHEEGATLDVMAMELELALRELARILGRDIDADLLDRVFSDFCIGK